MPRPRPNHGASRQPLRSALLGLALALAALSAWAGAQSVAAETGRLLSQGDAAAAETLLAQRLSADPNDAETRFALGAVQAMRSLERLAQDAYRYGLGSGSAGEIGLIFGIEVAANPSPEAVAYDDLRTALQRFLEGLEDAEATLLPLEDLVGSAAGGALKLRLELGLARFDFDGDGQPGQQLSALLFELRNLASFDPELNAVQPIPIAFDLGDALWLRGYLHLLAAILEAVLAYDAQDLWDATAQLFFARAETPFPYLSEASSTDFNDFDVATLVDVVALIHLLDLPLREPERLARSLAHLEATVALSRASWGAILAETDNDREWLPHPGQDSVIPSRGGGPALAVSDGMVDRWFVLLDELEAILAGRKLVPYWRVGDGRGINVRKVFLEPQRFDLLLWIQGAAVAPYLEAGELTQGDTWRDIVTAFGGQFGMFAFWFN